MKAILIALLVAITLGHAAEKEKVSIEEFREKKVLIGKLGKPFGTVLRATCSGFVPTEDERRTKAEWWKNQVDIVAIEGKRVDPPIRIEWSTFEADTVKKPAAGETLEVWGYETGKFRGVPAEAFKHVPPMATTGFGFMSTFVALKKAEPVKQQE
jgi:hypothetical protein